MVISLATPRVDGPLWASPVEPTVVVAEFRAPATPYSAGHRGLDLLAVPGGVVVAPESGVVAYTGVVGDRPVIAIEHPGGYRSSLEPVAASAALAVGDAVARGQPIGTVAAGGHCAAGCVHLGVRLDGEYLNPRLLYGGVPRAVLLPP
ncbi:peptidoglycan DD-metalloendopeptidase family protein [Herbiconiux sp. A18JL235]|uniref:Peptidoglycan DD-metalloendopeptidase family protein n=1 Tax=Herbiconiux sp. A18JL235 TaxID=3152363 RepID=A0AB39BDR0_9MICO